MFLIGIGFITGLGTLFLLLKFNDKSIYFGVRLPINFEITNELESIRKKYLIQGALYQVLLLIITLILPREFIYTTAVLIILIYMGIVYFMFFKANAKVKAIKKRDKWSGYSENIVIVDLKNKKNLKEQKSIPKILIIFPIILTFINFIIGMYIYISTKDELIPSKFGDNGVIEGYVTKGDIMSIVDMFMPFISQIVLTLTTFIVYICIIKSKNIINGGEVENIKEYNTKVKNSSIYYITFSLTICGLLFIGMYFIDNEGMFWIAMIILIFIILSLFIYIAYYDKNIKPYRGTYEVKDGKTIVNRDDDENYIGGMFYTNPSDPSLIIPKRVGIGWDLNYGNTKAKIFVIVVILILIITAVIIPFETKERIPDITQNSIKISGLYGTEINKNEISSITLEAFLPEGLSKVNGIGTEKKLIGSFKEDKIYSVRLYISDAKEKTIKILKKDGKRIYINYKNKEDTESMYKSLVNYIKN